MPNFVNRTDPTDRNPVSTGCAMAFLSWLQSQGHALNEIAPAMVHLGDPGTLAQLFADLTGEAAARAWPKFIAAVRALSGGVTSDDPFGGAAHVAQATSLEPRTVEIAGKLLSAILADLSAGRSAQQIVGNVQAILSTPASYRGAAAGCCQGSRRLRPPGLAAA
jgi:hypothetical protein